MDPVSILEEKIKTGQFIESLDCVRKMDEEYCENADYLNATGILFNSLQQREEALARFSRAVVIDPNNVDALYNLGSEQSYKGEPVQAALSFGKATGNCKEEGLKKELIGLLRKSIKKAALEQSDDFSARFALGLFLAIRIPSEKGYIIVAFTKNHKEFEIMNCCWQCAVDLESTGNASFLYKDERLIILIDGIRLAVDDRDILDTIAAVFKYGEYDFSAVVIVLFEMSA